jgi:hypothetical protein
MALDYGTNVKNSNEGINVNLMVYLSSDYHLMRMGSRSSVRFKINNDLFGERHTDPASDHKDPNPATLAPRLLWLSTMSQSS